MGGRETQEEGVIRIYLWLIHVVVWQKPTEHCKAILPQLKINLKKKNVKKNVSVTILKH